jgi:excisionase family DNA binding protein
MKRAQNSDFCSVTQAAARLQVSPSTIWRWIAQGRLPAYRVGPKTIRIRTQDLAAVIRPARAQGKQTPRAALHVETAPSRLSAAAVRRALAVLDESRALRAAMRARRGGELLEESWELIRQAREERSRELSGER